MKSPQTEICVGINVIPEAPVVPPTEGKLPVLPVAVKPPTPWGKYLASILATVGMVSIGVMVRQEESIKK